MPRTATVRAPRWPWLALGLGLAWTVLIRVPLVLNAADHLDSDLAVDGLTLLDAVHGHWRWHYPGTPHMGILPVALSYPQALAWGADPITLVSGGTVAWVLVLLSTFWLAWRAFGPEVAGWAIVPLVFSSPGTIWLSGRITGGHLLTLAWHTAAFVGLYECLARGGWRRAALLGLWCGLGLYLDAMFAFTLAGLVPCAGLAWWRQGRSRAGIRQAGVFLVALLTGLLPKGIGQRVDPYDAYPAQFSATFDRPALLAHAELLGVECLPRLIAGLNPHELRSRSGVFGMSTSAWLCNFLLSPQEFGRDFLFNVKLNFLWVTLLFLVAVPWLALVAVPGEDEAGRAVRRGVVLSAALILAAFLVNRNVFNADNYRYLVFLLTPWALGFGLLMRSLVRRGSAGRLAALASACLLAGLMTSSTFDWYQARQPYRYIDLELLPTRAPNRPWSSVKIKRGARTGLNYPRNVTVPARATHILGDYWEVYRIAFLSGGTIVGVPWPIYPNRFPGWSHGLGPRQGTLVVLDGTDGWRAGLEILWRGEGRDPAELSEMSVLAPRFRGGPPFQMVPFSDRSNP